MDSLDNRRITGSQADVSCATPLCLEPQFVERVWGMEQDSEAITRLYPPEPGRPQRIGEVWLTGSDNRVAGGPHAGKTLQQVTSECGAILLGASAPGHPSGQPVFPLLIKFLATTDKLSVQVHPPDSVAKAQGSWGKTEMWHILSTEPGARLAVGFCENAVRNLEANPAMLREAAASGAIEGMLDWREVHAGETYFVPAGTVHAIGPGVVLCEIQQHSDITYRLYDYRRPGMDGQPRALHLEEGLAVSRPRTAGGLTALLGWPGAPGRTLLAACSCFAAERWELRQATKLSPEDRPEIWIAIEGAAEFEAAGGHESVGKGQVVVIPAEAGAFSIRPAGESTFIRTYPPSWERDIVAPLRAAGLKPEQMLHTLFL